jgi:hypothetical protein
VVLGSLALAQAGCGSSGGSTVATTTPTAASLAPIHGAYDPSIDPDNFSSTIDNRYLPFKPGTTLRSRGVAENGKTPQTDVETVTHRTKQIVGVTCAVVRDTVSSRGKPIERTFDWYAQDNQGNVWYFGEDAREYHHGKFVKAPDSWESGVNGAQPGIIMPGNPQTGEAYRQEYYPGHAMDQARVVGHRTIKVPAGTYRSALVTLEGSSLEPGIKEQKYAAPGIGVVQEHVVKGNHERFDLTKVTHS